MRAGIFGFLFFIFFLTSSFGQNSPDLKSAKSSLVADAIDKLPVIGRKNVGQWDNRVLYKSMFKSSEICYLNNGLSFGFSRQINRAVGDNKIFSNNAQGMAPVLADSFAVTQVMVWNINFLGANTNPEVEASGEKGSMSNYFHGNEKYINVPDYSQLLYKNM